MKKILVTFLMSMIAVQLFAQDQGSTISDSLYASGKIYVVVACIVLILLGLLFFLFSIEKRLKKLEKKSSDKN
ncbi:CcmD family protein [Pedobacter frigoris]|uniref:CcmD family protein n=1 Tax=Pedobacter frigoris TaxID=2571272 RepID=UPI00292CC30F|nr:CcmD family protein [Pedobacter frigoris]